MLFDLKVVKADFVGSKQWIGGTELSWVLQRWFQVGVCVADLRPCHCVLGVKFLSCFTSLYSKVTMTEFELISGILPFFCLPQDEFELECAFATDIQGSEIGGKG